MKERSEWQGIRSGFLQETDAPHTGPFSGHPADTGSRPRLTTAGSPPGQALRER